MSLESKYEEVKKRFGFNPLSVIGKVIKGYEIDRYVGHGTIGVVFHATEKDTGDEAACKIMPRQKLNEEWKIELRKLVKLTDIPQVVQYKGHGAEIVEDVPQVFVLYQYVKGRNLREYARDCPELITLNFIENLARQILNVFQALKVENIVHGDLHEGNIMVADPDPRFPDTKTRIKVTDFGIGTSSSKPKLKDDYHQLALICSNLINKHVDPANLEGENRYFYSRFVTDFLRKELTESNVTAGESVREPTTLLANLDAIREQYKGLAMVNTASKLTGPFDYLSCESFGDSFELLQTLYSESFPGYQELSRRANTILTGPRGCGKTTIFRNLSLKTQILGKKIKYPQNFIGIYYHCSDLTFAFPYPFDKLGTSEQKTVTHFFNLAVLHEILDTLIVAAENEIAVPQKALERLQGFLQGWLMSYQTPPQGTPVLQHLLSLISVAKERFRDEMDKHGLEYGKWPPNTCKVVLTPQDFLMRLCRLLQDSIPWLKSIPFYFFLDDYSLPKVSDEVQLTLHNFILNRYSELFFKISTESVVTFDPKDAKGKMFEEGREYEIIDLGDYFLDAGHKTKMAFLGEVVNNRLENAEKFDWDSKVIGELLGKPPYETYVELAELIKSGEKKEKYSGWRIIVDLCSGDIANILRLIRNVFTNAKLKGRIKTYPIPDEIQDQGIRETSNRFFEKIKAIPDTGTHIAKIVQAFGDVSNYYLRMRRSKNIEKNPPYQAFRIELLETPDLDEEEPSRRLGPSTPAENWTLRRLYLDLIKYGVFIRDVKGKSQRGTVVPRLYLRRLLIPTFRLTPSKRDHIRVSAKEFKMLLMEPQKFKTHMIGKPYRDDTAGRQGRLDDE